MKVLKQNLAVSFVSLAVVALVARMFSSPSEQEPPKARPSAMATSLASAAPTASLSDDMAYVTRCDLPGPYGRPVPVEAVGPLSRDAPLRALARPVGIESGKLIFSAGGRRSALPRPYERGVRAGIQAFRGKSTLDHGAGSAVRLGVLPDGSGLVLEASGRDGVKPLPSFVPLLMDSKLWGHAAFNNIRYALNRGTADSRNYRIRSAFVGESEAIYVVVQWYESLHGWATSQVMARIVLRESGWEVTPLRAGSSEFWHCLPFIVAFRDRFFVFNGYQVLWFDSNGGLLREVPFKWETSEGLSEVEYKDGVLVVWFWDRVVCVDAWSGQVVGRFPVALH